MPLYISESQYYEDESFYENMVDEMYSPTNYEFSSGDVTNGDYIDPIIQRFFSFPISEHCNIHANRHA